MHVSENNMTTLSANFKRTVNNVTMAMPHSGVFAAAQDPINSIVQPRELNVRFNSYSTSLLYIPFKLTGVICRGLASIV